MSGLFTTAPAALADLRRNAYEGTLYAVLDACDEPRVPIKVRELGPGRAVSLYREPAESDLYAIAPYLVHLEPGQLQWIADTLWTAPWGIFATTESDIETVRTHFRKFLLVDAPDRDSWYFRWYDPRVLVKFLPTCDAAQLTDFFGPVTAFGWTDPETYGVTLARPQWFEPAPAPAKPRIVYRRTAP